jgi:hypothetical protein
MSRINNYEELVQERKKAEARIAALKFNLQAEVVIIQEKLHPILNLLPLLNIFKSGEQRSPLIKGVASLGIDLLFGQNLLAKSGWFTKLLVPVLLKAFSGKVIDVSRQ